MTTAMLAMLLSLGIFTTRDVVREMAVSAGVSPRLSACIIEAESQWDVNHLGDAGEIGLMQILPSTGEWAASKLGMDTYDLYAPVDNLRIGLWILRYFPEFFHTMYLCD